jgi:hypothetical protein
MAGKSNTSATFFAQKKLLGKAHTSNLKVDGEEVIGSNIQAATSLIFGEKIPQSPAQTLYLTQSASGSTNPSVEWIQFSLQALTGTTYDADSSGGGAGSDSGESSQSSGPHTYKFVLPTNYESLSDNSRAGNGVFDNSKLVHETLGAIQIVPPYFSQDAPNPYIIKLYQDSGGSPGTEIPLLDNIDWNVDYYNGILFLQDYKANKIPAFAKAFAYVGRMAEEVISSGSGGGAGDISGASNLGSGKGLFAQENSGNLQFKSVKGGSNISVSSDSTSITITSVVNAIDVSGISKFVKIFESDVSSGAAVAFSDFEAGLISNSGSLDVFYNGQLVLSGNQSSVTSGNADYYLSGSDSLKFGFDIFTDDILTLKQTLVSTGSAGTTTSYLLHSDDAGLANARVMTAGDGITISSANPRQLTISSTGLVARTKSFYELTASHPPTKALDVQGINFARSSYDFNKIDIHYNGQALRSGSNYDYVILNTGSIVFDFPLFIDDYIQITTF